MTAKVGEVRKLKTNDFGLVIDVRENYVVVAPGLVSAKRLAGRYVEKNDVQFALDFAVPVSNVVLGETLGRVNTNVVKVGRDAPKALNSLYERWEMIRYIDSAEDVDRVLGIK